ncbi:enoyl-CoA hydratase/isomerase family protein [Halobacteriales archaeon Cl-PHB]
MTDYIQTTTDGAQYTIRFDREEALNSIDADAMAAIHAALDEFEADADARVLVFTGSGDAFCAGADIGHIGGFLDDEDWGGLMHFLRDGQELMDRIASLRAPTIAAINGYALGGGLELALACDFRFASEAAQLGLPEIDIGMISGWGGTQRLPHVVGSSTARDMLLTGRKLGADEAAEVGLVDAVRPDDDLADYVDDYAGTLGEKPPETVPLILDAVRAGEENPMEGGLTYELMSNMFAGFTDDAQAAIAEFAGE